MMLEIFTVEWIWVISESFNMQYVCNMAAYSDTKALTRRYPNNSFLSWPLSSLSLGGCFLRNLNITGLSYFDLPLPVL